MKKAKIEGEIAHGYGLYVEKTPSKGDRLITLYGYDVFNFLNKVFPINQRLIISIDESNGAKSFLIAVATPNNGYIRRERQSGQFEIGRVFHIASPIYFVKEPFEAKTNESKEITTTSSENYLMLFPDGNTDLHVTVDYYEMDNPFTTYGRCLGVAGYDIYYETTGISTKSELPNPNLFQVKNEARSNPNSRFYAVGGKYEIF